MLSRDWSTWMVPFQHMVPSFIGSAFDVQLVLPTAVQANHPSWLSDIACQMMLCDSCSDAVLKQSTTHRFVPLVLWWCMVAIKICVQPL